MAMAKLLKVTLTSNVVAWHTNLLSNSIGSWEELKRSFLAHYIHQTDREVDISYLQPLEHKYGKTPRNFFGRWKNLLPNSRRLNQVGNLNIR